MEKEKKDSHSDEVVKLQKHKIMLWCVIVVIGFFLIVQYSVANCENTVLAAQFSFASTITSIILSVIAIIMSVVSGESLNNLLHKSRDLHDEIKDVPSKIDSSMDNLSASSIKLEKLRDELMEIPGKVERSIITSVKVMNESIIGVSGGIETLNHVVEAGFVNITKNYVPANNTLSLVDNESTVEALEGQFLRSSSISGLSLLLYIIIAFEKGRNVSLKEFSKLMSEEESFLDYVHGYYVAMSALGHFFQNEMLEGEFVFKIVKVKTGLKNSVISSLQKRVESDESFDKETFIDSIEKVFDR